MRLIDADELSIIKEKLRIFDSFISSITRQYTDEHQAIYEHWIDCRYEIENIIDNLPTAYDVEKVVEQLENKSLKCKMESAKVFCEEDYRNNTLMQYVKHSEDMKAFAYDNAIEIVKAGGIDG